jgi:hypothetical protein
LCDLLPLNAGEAGQGADRLMAASKPSKAAAAQLVVIRRSLISDRGLTASSTTAVAGWHEFSAVLC